VKTFALLLLCRRAKLALVVIGCACSSSAFAQVIVNGGFETGNPGYGGVNTVVNGAVVSGWTVITLSGTSELAVAKPSVPTPNDWGANNPAPVEGLQYLAFNTRDTAAGVIRIYQDFSTTIGMSYDITFTVGASSATGPEPLNQPVAVQADIYNVLGGVTSGGALETLTASGTASGANGEFFSESSFSFVATGTTSRLVFTDMSLTTRNVDALLDGVSVAASPIPEPSTYAALAGVLMLGVAAWHRRKRASASPAHRS
jgi:hypothetical protein